MRFVEVIDFDQLPCQQKGKRFLFINEAVFSDERCGLLFIEILYFLAFPRTCGDLILGVQRFNTQSQKCERITSIFEPVV